MDGDGSFDGLSAMGFNMLHNFEEVSCDAATMVSFLAYNPSLIHYDAYDRVSKTCADYVLTLTQGTMVPPS